MFTKKLNKISAAICIVSLMLTLCSCGKNNDKKYPEITEQIYVNDFAGLLTETAEDQMLDSGKILYSKTPVQVVAVAIASSGKQSIKAYAEELSERWGKGNKKSPDSVLIVMASNNGDFHIVVGKNLKKDALTNQKLRKLTKFYKEKYISENNYPLCLSMLYKTVVNEVYLAKGFSTEEYYTPVSELEVSMSPILVLLIAVGILIAAVITIFIAIIIFKNKKKVTRR